VHNCFCNICSAPMFSKNPQVKPNFCGSECRDIHRRPAPKERMSLNYAPRGNGPAAMAMGPWCSPRIVRRSYSPSKTLRIRGDRVKKLTTKRMQNV
jgi:hypothetical protein